LDDTNGVPVVDYLELTVGLIAAYVSNNSVRAADLPTLIADVHAGFASLSAPPKPTDAPEIEKATPAQIRKSITPDALISFVDGKPYKTLRRHLGTHGLTIEAYRARYGLPVDYPAVSARYSETRSALARSIGLGQQRGKGEPAATAKEATPAEAPRRGRPRKTKEPIATE